MPFLFSQRAPLLMQTEDAAPVPTLVPKTQAPRLQHYCGTFTRE